MAEVLANEDVDGRWRFENGDHNDRYAGTEQYHWSISDDLISLCSIEERPTRYEPRVEEEKSESNSSENLEFDDDFDLGNSLWQMWIEAKQSMIDDLECNLEENGENSIIGLKIG